MKPTLVVKSDYNGYFEGLARKIISLAEQAGHEFKYKTVIVTAGPYRSDAMTVNKVPEDETAVRIDFYSALRNGFGSLEEGDLARAGLLL